VEEGVSLMKKNIPKYRVNKGLIRRLVGLPVIKNEKGGNGMALAMKTPFEKFDRCRELLESKKIIRIETCRLDPEILETLISECNEDTCITRQIPGRSQEYLRQFRSR